MTHSLPALSAVQPGVTWGWPRWLLALALVLCLAALLSVWLGGHHSLASRIVWTFVVTLIPILGPLAWFTLGWERR